jgi:hypothetical protein
MKALLLAVVLVVAACHKKSDAPPCSGAKTAHVEIKRVDEDSPYMKKLFAHVGSTRDGAATDPAAVAAGVKADIDQWHWDEQTKDGMPAGGKRFTDYYLTAPDRTTLEKYVAALGPEYAPPSDRQLVFEPVTYQDKHYWRSYYVVAAPVLDDASFARVSASLDPNTNRPLVLVDMTEDGRARWAKASREAVGHKLAILVDGTVGSAPIINGAIEGGRAAITFTDEDAAKTLVQKLGCTP